MQYNLNALKKFFVSFTLLFFSLIVYGQQPSSKVTVTGHIIDSVSHRSIEFATISFKGNDNLVGTTSATDGNFSIDINPGTYTIKVEFLSYHPVELRDKELTADTDLGTLLLSYAAEQLDEIELIAKKDLVEYGVNKKIYNASLDIANQGGNGFVVLQNTPSLQVDSDGSVTMRGGSVQILIDGKPIVGLENTTDIIKTIPASMIDRVELITASSKYDADGGSGIVNIITKKKTDEGINGTIDIHGGTPANNGGSTFINETTDKINLYSTISFNNEKKIRRHFLDQQPLNPDVVGDFDYHQQRKDYRQRNSLLFNIGSDFKLNPKNTLSTSVLINSDHKNYTSYISADEFNRDGNLIQQTIRDVTDKDDISRVEGTLGYVSKFSKEGEQLSVKFTYENNVSAANSNINNEIKVPETFLSTDKDKLHKNQNLDNIMGKVDYSLPLSDIDNLEIGHKTTLRYYKSSLDASRFNTTTDLFTQLSLPDNALSYDESVYAFYTQFSHNGEKFSYSFGLRAELSQINVSQKAQIGELSKKYSNLFPSASISYTINDNSYLSLEYRRGIDRPELSQINPFIDFIDNRLNFVGNPELNPSFNHYLLLSYELGLEKFAIASSIFMNYKSDNIMFMLEYLGQNSDGINEYQYIFRNNGENNALGVDLDLTYQPNETFTFNTYISPFQNKTQNTLNKSYDFESITWYIQSRAMLSLKNGLNFSVSHLYQSPYKNKLFTYGTMNYFDASVSKNILKNKAKLTLTLNDVFNNKLIKYYSYEADTYSYRYFKYDPQLTVAFTYNFNKQRNSDKNRSKEVKTDLFDNKQD